MPADIKYEFYIDTDDTGEVANLNPKEIVETGLNQGVSITNHSGGITFDEAGYLRGGKTLCGTGVGFWLGFDLTDYVYKACFGDPANEHLVWDGDDLIIDIDNTNLTVNGGSTGQGLTSAADGTIAFVDLVATLDDLTDVTITSAASPEVLKYDGTGWVNATLSLSDISGSLNLEDLGNVAATTPATNQVLGWSGTTWQPQNASSTFSLALEDLTNVATTTPTTNQVLGWSGTTWQPQNASSTFSLAFEDLSNAVGGTPSYGDVWMKTGASGFEPTGFEIQNLINVSASSPSHKDMLVYDTFTQDWVAQSSSTVAANLQQTLGDHTDVEVTGSNAASNGDVLYYLSSANRWRPGDYTFSPADISTSPPKKRVNLVSPAGNIVDYFELQALNGIELGRTGDVIEIENIADVFKTISVSGQSNVVADSLTDTLTFAAGTNMTITTNASTDTITFNAIQNGLALNDLTDVTTSPSNGDVLWYNNSNSRWEEGDYNLSALSLTGTTKKRIALMNPAGGYTSGDYVDLEPMDGISLALTGGAIQIENSATAFKTIAVANQSNVVADSLTDTLTFVAGSNMTITTNATTDTITFASTGSGGGALALNDLTDVFTSPANGDVLYRNSSNSRWEEGSYQLSAADAASGDNKEIRLIKPSGSYSTTGVIKLDPGDGISMSRSSNVITVNNSAYAFKTIQCAGETDIVAGAVEDTLTFEAGSRMDISFTPSLNKITLQPDDQTASLTYFKTINVNGTTNVNANQKNDTLNLVAGSNITLTPSNANSQITISASTGSSGTPIIEKIQDQDADTVIRTEASPDEDAIRFYTGSSSNTSFHAAMIENRKMAVGSASSQGPVADLDVMVSGTPHLRLYNYSASSGSFPDAKLEFDTANHSDAKHRIIYQDNNSYPKGEITYDHNLNDLIFYVNSGSATPTDKIRFLNSGGITFDGETTEPHALDDYEEGTWTPHFADAQTGGNYVTASTAGTGSYTKIGDVVHVSCPAQNINPSGLTSGNILYIRNFPFTIASTYLQVPATSVNFTSRAANSMSGAYFQAYPGGTYGFIVKPDSSNATESQQTVGDVLRTTTLGGQYTGIRFSFTYKAA